MADQPKKPWINSQAAGADKPWAKAKQAGFARRAILPMEMSWEYARRMQQEDSTRFAYEDEEETGGFDDESAGDRLRYRH